MPRTSSSRSTTTASWPALNLDSRCASTPRWVCSPSAAGSRWPGTPERMEELRRRMASARTGASRPGWSHRTTSTSVSRSWMRTSCSAGSARRRSAVVDSTPRRHALPRVGSALRARRRSPPSRWSAWSVEQGRIKRVRTTGGDIEAETVVIACGVWSPKLAKMAGASIPLTPAVHQMISVGPIPQLAERPGEDLVFPIVRDMDTFCYERQHGADMEVGSYAHRAILYDGRRDPVDRAVEALPPPSCRSRPTTSTPSSSRHSSSCRTRSARTGPRSATRSTACSR